MRENGNGNSGRGRLTLHSVPEFRAATERVTAIGRQRGKVVEQIAELTARLAADPAEARKRRVRQIVAVGAGGRAAATSPLRTELRQLQDQEADLLADLHLAKEELWAATRKASREVTRAAAPELNTRLQAVADAAVAMQEAVAAYNRTLREIHQENAPPGVTLTPYASLQEDGPVCTWLRQAAETFGIEADHG